MAYPNGGGAFIVAKDNLGPIPGTVAGASLILDYILTVAVSIASGVLAVTSAVPELSTHAVELSLGVLVVLVLVNLRGVRESGFVFALPTYGFIFAVGALVRHRLRARADLGMAHRTRPRRRARRPRG